MAEELRGPVAATASLDQIGVGGSGSTLETRASAGNLSMAAIAAQRPREVGSGRNGKKRGGGGGGGSSLAPESVGGPRLGVEDSRETLEPDVKKTTLKRGDFSHDEDRDEFLQIDYTPCITTNPVDMDYPLRVRRQDKDVTLMVCITVYNEGPDMLDRTLKGLAGNLVDLSVKAGIDPDEVVVCVMLDGRREADEFMLDYLRNDIKVYDPDLIEIQHKNKDVMMHLFEKSVELPKHPTAREYYEPLQMILALKELNGGKLNSHLWFFTAFCTQVQPKYVLLIDVGTVPAEGAVNNMVVAMEHNDQIGGVCGELEVYEPKPFNLFQAAQHFEYKMNHVSPTKRVIQLPNVSDALRFFKPQVMDKTMESMFGFINVLPGAFSAYRWVAIRGQPLNEYFYVEEHSIDELGPFVANLYLAEDRVLCFNLVAKAHRSWTCHYVANADAATDVPKSLLGLMTQRRRWLNGSLFALIYYIKNFKRFARDTNHSISRLTFLSLQFCYQVVLLLMNWFALGSMYLILVVLMALTTRNLPEGSEELIYTFTVGYTFLTVAQLVVGLGSQKEDVWIVYWLSSAMYALLMAISVASGIYLLVAGELSTLVSSTGLISIIGYIACALLHGDLLTMSWSFIQYLLMMPTYVNILAMYSFCNMNDVSWGTKDVRYVHGKHRALGIRDPREVAEELAKERAKKAAEERAARGDISGDEDGDGKLDEQESKKKKLSNAKKGLRDLAKLHGKAKKAENAWDTLAEVVDQVTNDEFDLRRNKAAVIMAAARGTDLMKAQQEILDHLEDEEKRVRREVAVEEETNRAVKREFAAFRTRLLGLWLTTNFIGITIFLYFDTTEWFAWGFTIAIAFILGLRIVGSILYQIEAVVKRCWHSSEEVFVAICPDFCCVDSDSDDEEAPYDPPCWRRVCCWLCDSRKRFRDRTRRHEWVRRQRELEDARGSGSDSDTRSSFSGDEDAEAGPGYRGGPPGQRKLRTTQSGTGAMWMDPYNSYARSGVATPAQSEFMAAQMQMQAQYAAAGGRGPPMGMPMPMGPGAMVPGAMPGMPPGSQYVSSDTRRPHSGQSRATKATAATDGARERERERREREEKQREAHLAEARRKEREAAEKAAAKAEREAAAARRREVKGAEDDAAGRGAASHPLDAELDRRKRSVEKKSPVIGPQSVDGQDEAPRERSLSFTLAQTAFRDDTLEQTRLAPTGGVVPAADAAQQHIPRTNSAPGLGFATPDSMKEREVEVEVTEDGAVRRVKRERMVDLMTALDDGEQLSEVLAPKEFRGGMARWNTLRNTGRFALTGRRKRTQEDVDRERIAAIKRRTGKF